VLAQLVCAEIAQQIRATALRRGGNEAREFSDAASHRQAISTNGGIRLNDHPVTDLAMVADTHTSVQKSGFTDFDVNADADVSHQSAVICDFALRAHQAKWSIETF